MSLAAFSPANARRVVLTTAAVCLAAFAVAADPETREVTVESIKLTIPATWKEEPPSNNLRAAQFKVPSAEGDTRPTEMVVSHFGGTGGDVDANLSRWVGQFGGEGRTVKVTKGKSPLGSYYLLNASGTYKMPIGPPILRKTEDLPNARMIAVILETGKEGNYFLKLAGEEKTVAAQLDAMRASIGGDAATEKAYELK